MTTPEIDQPKDRDELRTRLLLEPEALADAVIRALSAAGGQAEWHSETIEQVLQPFSALVERAGMPSFGDTGSDLEALDAWRAMDPENWARLCPICMAEGYAEEHDASDHDEDDEEIS